MREGKLKEYAKLIRIQTLGIATVAVFGALTVGKFTTQLDIIDIFHVFLLFLIGILVQIYGFVLNDYADVKIDKLSKELFERPLVKGTISRKSALIISLLSMVLAYMIAMIFFNQIFALLILGISIGLAAIYDLFGKRFLGSDVFVAGASALFCLFGAAAVSNEIRGLTWIIVTLTFIQMFFMNAIEGGLKDVDHDRKAGAKTIAIYLGVKTGKMSIPNSFKVIAICLRSTSAILIFIPFLMFGLEFWHWQIALLLILIVIMFHFMIKMLYMPFFNMEKLRDNIRIQELARYSMVPIMLMSFIGISWALFLILLPFIWYAFFTFILYGKPLKPAKTL